MICCPCWLQVVAATVLTRFTRPMRIQMNGSAQDNEVDQVRDEVRNETNGTDFDQRDVGPCGSPPAD